MREVEGSAAPRTPPARGDASRIDAVFEGGGVKAIALLGAAAEVEAAGYRFVNVAGTSAGAIVAALLAAGYDAAAARRIMARLDFATLADPARFGRLPLCGHALDLLFSGGIFKGDMLLETLRALLARRGVRTFRDLVLPRFATDPRYRYRLRVVAADISRGRKLVLPGDARDYGLAPDDLEVALAVRMSASIPFFFVPTRLGASQIVDGALLSNFPLDLFERGAERGWHTFGFKLVRSTGTAPPRTVRHVINGPLSRLVAMFHTAMEAHDAYYLRDEQFARTIAIDTLGVAATDFGLTATRKEALYQSGRRAAQEFLRAWDQAAYWARYQPVADAPTRRQRVLAYMGTGARGAGDRAGAEVSAPGPPARPSAHWRGR